MGEHVHLCTQAAIKVLQMRLLESNCEDFLREARTVAHLLHPNIIRVLDFGVQDTVPYLVMDYAAGGTLRQHYMHGSPLPLASLVPYISQAASALQYAHDRRVVHRDVKPENMLLGVNNEILMSDFGLALVTQNSSSRPTKDMSGTAGYMAPEQVQGKPRATSDQYALAIIAYEWLTGERPFQGSFLEVATQHVLAAPASLREKVPSIPEAVDKVIMQALAKDPQERFASVQDFAVALEQAYKEVEATFPSSSLPVASTPQFRESGVLPLAPQATQAISVEDSTSQLEPMSDELVAPSNQTIFQVSYSTQPLEKLTTAEESQAASWQSAESNTTENHELMVDFSTPAQTPLAGKGEQVDARLSSSMSGPLVTPQHAKKNDQGASNVPLALASGSDSAAPPVLPGWQNHSTGRKKPFIWLSGLLVLVLVVASASIWYFSSSNRSVSHGASPVVTAQANTTQPSSLTVTALPQGAVTPTSAIQPGSKPSAGAASPTALAPTKVPTLTPSPQAGTANPYPPYSGKLQLDDPLTSNIHNWASSSYCSFSGGSYHVTVSPGTLMPCTMQNASYTDFTYEVQMTFVNSGQQDSAGGLIFRDGSNMGSFYYFKIYSNGQYTFGICVKGSDCSHVLATNTNQISSMSSKLARSNTLAVVAQSSVFTLYLNGQPIAGPIKDISLSSGSIGVYADGGVEKTLSIKLGGSSNTDVAFNNARVWAL
nr:protein kinase [Ktedonosporobacter rubrisoli]